MTPDWLTNLVKALTNLPDAQPTINQIPTTDLQQYGRNPLERLLLSIPQGMVNSPHTSLTAANQFGNQFVNQQMTPGQILGDTYNMAQLPLSVMAAGGLAKAGMAGIQGATQGLGNEAGTSVIPDVPLSRPPLNGPPLTPGAEMPGLKAIGAQEDNGVFDLNNPEIKSNFLNGWPSPTFKKNFDMALLMKDSNAIKMMLPQVPKQYLASFAGQIATALGK